MERLVGAEMEQVVQAVLECSSRVPASRCVLVGISGIDGSGKGYISDWLVARLREAGVKAEVIHGDGWLNLPDVRFGTVDPPRHFYEHAFRFEEMFAKLLLPLQRHRSVRLI